MIGLTSKITDEVSFGRRDPHLHLSEQINQSINQSNFYSANIPGEARLSGATAKSVFNSKIDEASMLKCLALGHKPENEPTFPQTVRRCSH